MARPKKNDPDLLKRNVDSLKRAQRRREEEDLDVLWARMVDLYRGKHYASSASEDRMLVNLAFATKNVIAPSIAINNPKFTVNARKPDAANQAVIVEQVLNYLWRNYRYQDEFRLAVDDFLVMGHGWLKVGYKATKPAKIIEVEDIDSDDSEGVDDREDIPGNTETEARSFGEDDRPFVERISPFDVFVDPDARSLKEAKWIAQRTRRPLVDVMVDGRYDKAVRREVSATTMEARQDDQFGIAGRGRDTGDIDYVDIWEFWDLRRETVSTFAEASLEGYLIPPHEMPYAFGHPFVMLRNYEVPDEFYPMGELEAIEGLQKELNATRTQMMNHRKRYQRKVLYDKEAFDSAGIEALRDDKDNVLVPVDTASAQVNISQVVAPMPQMGTPPDFYNQSDLISNDIDRVSGVSDYMRGAQAEIRRTATEAAMINDAMNARSGDKLGRIESSLGQIGRRLVQLLQQYMTGEMVVRIAGQGPSKAWVTLDSDYIQGEFDFEVEGGSTQPRNESFRRQSAMQLSEAMGPFIGTGVIDPVAVARHVLQFGFDVKDIEAFLVPPPPPGMEGMPQEGMPPQGPQGPPQVPQGPPQGPQGAMPPQGPPPQEGPDPEAVMVAVQQMVEQGMPPEAIAQALTEMGLPPELIQQIMMMLQGGQPEAAPQGLLAEGPPPGMPMM